MSRPLPKWMVLAAALALAACSSPAAGPDRPASYIYATEDHKALSKRVRMQQQLTAVAFPILRSAQGFCGDEIRLSHGLTVARECTYRVRNPLTMKTEEGESWAMLLNPRMVVAVTEEPLTPDEPEE